MVHHVVFVYLAIICFVLCQTEGQDFPSGMNQLFTRKIIFIYIMCILYHQGGGSVLVYPMKNTQLHKFKQTFTQSERTPIKV
mmetsp:Transcript_72423/g.127679  ORF Transcript_72423/g.127679 Transcript_72423/m.127679 type:complete len:82 (-) Transcript_72423:7-252(-)